MKKTFVLTPNMNKRLISTLMSSRNAESNESKSFALKSSSEFASRSGDVFGKLQTLEKNHETWITENKTIEYSDETDGHGISQPDSEVVFKKPLPLRRLKRKASVASKLDKQPQKWTKYSLEDTPVSSDATNSAVALQFMDELRKSRERKSDVSENTEKILFVKPQDKKHKAAPSKICESVAVDSVSNPPPDKEVVLDEDKTSSCNIKLDHLQNEA